MSDVQPFPTSEQRRAMEKRCRWLMKTRKVLELRLAFYARRYGQTDSEDPLDRRETMGELLNEDPALRIPVLSGLVFHGPIALWNQFDIALVMDRNQSNISRTLKDVKKGGKYPEAWKRRLEDCTHQTNGRTAGYDERVFALLLDCQEEDYLLRFLKPRRGSEPLSPEAEERLRHFWEEEKKRAEADIVSLGLTDRDVWGLNRTPDPKDEGWEDDDTPTLRDAFMELLRGMARWKGAWAVATLLSIYTELSTFFHNLYAWFPLIALAAAALCLLSLRRGVPGRVLWRSAGSTALLILVIWTVCFVGRGFSVENPSLLTRLPLMEKLQEGIARLEGIEAQRTAETQTLLEEALSVTNAFLTERRRNDTPVSDAEYQQMLRRTEVREVPASLRDLRLALRVNEARLYLDWAVDDYRSGLAKLQTAERLLTQVRDERSKDGGKEERNDVLEGQAALALAGVFFAGMERGMWGERRDEAIRTAEEAAAILRDRSPREAAEALELCSHLLYLRAAQPIEPDSADLRRAEETAREGLALSRANGHFLYPDLAAALGRALAALDRNEEAIRAFEDGIRHTDMQFQPNRYVHLSAALAKVCATLYLDKNDSTRQKDAEMALSAALGVLNRHAHLTADASLQFAVANASLAVGLAAGSRQEVDRALDALDKVLEIWTFTPYTANHIQAAYTQALALTSLAFIPPRHEGHKGSGNPDQEAGRTDSPLDGLGGNTGRDLAKLLTPSDFEAGMEALGKAAAILERIAYYDRTNPTLSQKCAGDLFKAYLTLAEIHAVTGAMSVINGEADGEEHHAAAVQALDRARELAGGEGAETIAQMEKFLGEARLKTAAIRMLMRLTGRTSQDLLVAP